MRRLAGFAAVFALVSGIAVSAFADPPRGPVVQLDPITVQGRRQTPVEYVLNRAAQRYEERELRRTFVPNVVRTVRSEPF
jgi:hypothetical protein